MDSHIEPIDAPWQQGSDVPPGAERDRSPNVHGMERAVSGAGGVALLAMALRRGGLFGLLQAAVGTGLLVRGVTGHCSAKRMLAPSRFEADVARQHGWHAATAVTRSVTIGRPRREVYEYWRRFSNLGYFMQHIERIDVLDDKRSRWVVKAPMGQTVEWVSQVTEDIPGERIAWETEADADIRSTGWVEFTDAPGERGTQVRAMVAYEPPGGRLGHLAAKLWREDPTTQMSDDLRRLKQVLETGEVTTSAISSN